MIFPIGSLEAYIDVIFHVSFPFVFDSPLEEINSNLNFLISFKINLPNSAPLISTEFHPLFKEMSSVKAIWHLINDSGTPNYKVRILEGWRIEEIAEELYKEGIIEDAGLFIALAKDTKSEGYLFPSTYQLPKKMSPQAVLGVMKDEYNKQIAPLIAEANSNLTENEINLIN